MKIYVKNRKRIQAKVSIVYLRKFYVTTWSYYTKNKLNS